MLFRSALNLIDEALFTLALAASLDPNHPLPRYHATELYLEQKRVDDAKAEFYIFKELVTHGNRKDLLPAVTQLENKLTAL